MSDVDFELFERLIRESRDESRTTRRELGIEIAQMREEMRAGFASLKAHNYALHADMQNVERRVSDLELQVERLSTAQGINQDD